jgi:hypothetical protein
MVRDWTVFSRGLAALALLGGGALSVLACDGSLCETRALSEVEAPGGQYKAAISEVDCGATGISVSVEILAMDESPETTKRQSIFGLPGPGDDDAGIRLQWLSDTELFITSTKERTPSRALRQAESPDGVAIAVDYNKFWPGVPDGLPIPSYPPIETENTEVED